MLFLLLYRHSGNNPGFNEQLSYPFSKRKADIVQLLSFDATPFRRCPRSECQRSCRFLELHFGNPTNLMVLSSNLLHFKLGLRYNASQLSTIWSCILSSEDSEKPSSKVLLVAIWSQIRDTLCKCICLSVISSPDSLLASRGVFGFSETPVHAHSSRWSIWMINPDCNPMMDEIHQILWARKIYLWSLV